MGCFLPTLSPSTRLCNLARNISGPFGSCVLYLLFGLCIWTLLGCKQQLWVTNLPTASLKFPSPLPPSLARSWPWVWTGGCCRASLGLADTLPCGDAALLAWWKAVQWKGTEPRPWGISFHGNCWGAKPPRLRFSGPSWAVSSLQTALAQGSEC